MNARERYRVKLAMLVAIMLSLICLVASAIRRSICAFLSDNARSVARAVVRPGVVKGVCSDGPENTAHDSAALHARLTINPITRSFSSNLSTGFLPHGPDHDCRFSHNDVHGSTSALDDAAPLDELHEFVIAGLAPDRHRVFPDTNGSPNCCAK